MKQGNKTRHLTDFELVLSVVHACMSSLVVSAQNPKYLLFSYRRQPFYPILFSNFFIRRPPFGTHYSMIFVLPSVAIYLFLPHLPA